MTKLVVVDANVLVALSSGRDALHARAELLWNALTQTTAEVVFLDCVMTETLSVLARRLGEQKQQAEFVRSLDVFLERFPLQSWYWVTRYAQEWAPETIALMRSTWGRLNFNDALIATTCQKLGGATLISFDADFDEVNGVVRCGSAAEVAKIVG